MKEQGKCKMKRYLLFGGAGYYPSGGAYDLIKDYTILGAAKKRGKKMIQDNMIIPSCDWAHVLDTDTKEIIEIREV